MSTFWGFRCQTCKESSLKWFNKGQTKLEEIFLFWLHIKPIRRSNFLDVEIEGCQFEDRQDIFDFLEKHFEHQIKIENEYGDIWE